MIRTPLWQKRVFGDLVQMRSKTGVHLVDCVGLSDDLRLRSRVKGRGCCTVDGSSARRWIVVAGAGRAGWARTLGRRRCSVT